MSGYWDAYAKLDGYWALQESAGTTVADSIGANTGVMEGGMDAATAAGVGPNGWLPAALDFDGVANAIRVPYDAALHSSDQYTLFACVNLDATPDASGDTPFCAIELGSSAGAMLAADDSNSWLHTHGSGSAFINALGGSIAPGQWQHLAIVRDAAGLKVTYLDGAPVYGPLASTYFGISSTPIYIGAMDFGPVRVSHFNGRIAGVGVAKVGLSQDEMAEIVAGPEPTNVSPPTISGEARVGSTLSLSSEFWNNHGNGSQATSHELQQSDDGATGWSLVSGSTDVATLQLSAGLEGKYIRVSSTATNDGGRSDEVSSSVVLVKEAKTPWIVKAVEQSVHGALQGEPAVAGAEASQVITR